MIKLELEVYCDECPDFEADVKKKVVQYSFNDDKLKEVTECIVTCAYRDTCKRIHRFLEKQKGG